MGPRNSTTWVESRDEEPITAPNDTRIALPPREHRTSLDSDAGPDAAAQALGSMKPLLIVLDGSTELVISSPLLRFSRVSGSEEDPVFEPLEHDEWRVGADGVVAFAPDVLLREGSLVCHPKGYVARDVPIDELAYVSSMGEYPFTINLAPGVRVHGTVSDFETLAPLRGARIRTEPSWLATFVALTDEGGSFEGFFYPAEPSRWSLIASREGYANLVLSSDFLEAPDRELTLGLARTSRLRGRVRSTDGQPVPGATIRWWLRLGEYTRTEVLDREFPPLAELANGPYDVSIARRSDFAVSGGDGRFEFDSVPPFTRGVVQVTESGYSLRSHDIEEMRPGLQQESLEITLTPETQVRFRILVNGEPSPGFVCVGRSVGRRWCRDEGSGAEIGLEEGTFEFIPIPDSVVDETLCLPFARTLTIRPESVEADPIEFDVLLPMTTISGRVVWPAEALDGLDEWGMVAVLPTVDITAKTRGRSYPLEFRTRTDSRGQFSIQMAAGLSETFVVRTESDSCLDAIELIVPEGSSGVRFHVEDQSQLTLMVEVPRDLYLPAQVYLTAILPSTRFGYEDAIPWTKWPRRIDDAHIALDLTGCSRTYHYFLQMWVGDTNFWAWMPKLRVPSGGGSVHDVTVQQSRMLDMQLEPGSPKRWLRVLPSFLVHGMSESDLRILTEDLWEISPALKGLGREVPLHTGLSSVSLPVFGPDQVVSVLDAGRNWLRTERVNIQPGGRGFLSVR